MRTTLTLDRDVAARLRQLKKTGLTFKELVNMALRAGLSDLESHEPASKGNYKIQACSGMPWRTDLDNVAQVIADSEGDQFR